jgi:hypothetical protein
MRIEVGAEKTRLPQAFALKTLDKLPNALNALKGIELAETVSFETWQVASKNIDCTCESIPEKCGREQFQWVSENTPTVPLFRRQPPGPTGRSLPGAILIGNIGT